MVQYPVTEVAAARNGAAVQMNPMTDWSNEITPEQSFLEQDRRQFNGRNGMVMQNAMQSGMQGGTMMQPQIRLDMRNTVSDEVIESPISVSEAHLGSLKAMLQRNRGNYIVATFLIGTQSTVSFEGILYEVGNDFVTIYQEGRNRYIVVDMYSLKYIEFYDTRGRAMCQAMLQESGNWQML